jgi:hypothetical protein
MATNLGHHTVALRAATDDLPAKARQPPADKFAAALYSDDVLIIASEDHWYNVAPLNIRATDPQPLGHTHHEFCLEFVPNRDSVWKKVSLPAGAAGRFRGWPLAGILLRLNSLCLAAGGTGIAAPRRCVYRCQRT